jgi:hypothetical protein
MNTDSNSGVNSNFFDLLYVPRWALFSVLLNLSGREYDKMRHATYEYLRTRLQILAEFQSEFQFRC